jgi:hypothetical protein
MEDVFYQNPFNETIYCPVCDKSFGKRSKKGHAATKTHQTNLEKALKKVKDKEDAFNQKILQRKQEQQGLEEAEAANAGINNKKDENKTGQYVMNTIRRREKLNLSLKRANEEVTRFAKDKRNGLLKRIQVDENSSEELQADTSEKSHYFYKDLTDEDKENIKKGPGYISIEFTYIEERKSAKTGQMVKYEGKGHGWAYCSQKSITYLYSIHLNIPIFPEFFDEATNYEFEEQISEFGTVHYDRFMKITKITRHKEEPQISIKKLPLKASGQEKQMTLGSYGGKYAVYNKIPYYRKNSCMTSFFMGRFKGKHPAKKRNQEMTHEFLNKLATKKKVKTRSRCTYFIRTSTNVG